MVLTVLLETTPDLVTHSNLRINLSRLLRNKTKSDSVVISANRQ
jgi:hypothetical protein